MASKLEKKDWRSFLDVIDNQLGRQVEGAVDQNQSAWNKFLK